MALTHLYLQWMQSLVSELSEGSPVRSLTRSPQNGDKVTGNAMQVERSPRLNLRKKGFVQRLTAFSARALERVRMLACRTKGPKVLSELRQLH